MPKSAGDPQTLLGAAFRYANQQTPLALITLSIIGFLCWLYVTVLQGMSLDLHDHVRDSTWYQRQSCISLAILAGTSTDLCNPKDPAPTR